MNSIRLIIDKAATGAWNMAVDQAILESVDVSGLPTLRFYSWLPATLSLGYFQSLDSRNEHAESLPAPVVRRASGGGAILHHHEITYSIVVPSKARWSKRNTELYRQIHAAITEVFASFQIVLDPYDDNHPPPESPNDFLCFNRRSDGDLVLDKFKVVGSAQRRSRNALLQHGSVLLKKSEFAPQLPGIFDLAEINADTAGLTKRLADVISAHLGYCLQPGHLTRDETDLAQQIDRDRFSTENWTNKRRSKK